MVLVARACSEACGKWHALSTTDDTLLSTVDALYLELEVRLTHVGWP